MGGSGSGNWYRFSKQPTQDAFWQLNIAQMRKLGAIEDGVCKRGEWKWLTNGEVRSVIGYALDTIAPQPTLRVIYSNKREGRDYDYKIRLTTTTPNYGGKRWWFICPNAGCGKRVGVLYLQHQFACRHCYSMAYNSQNEPPHYRALHKAQAIHMALGGSGCVHEWLEKPKHMHWRTFHRKIAEMNALDAEANLAALSAFGIHYREWQ